ncbi:MAG: MoxR family ATPase [Gammaproteobacteria bacterium]|nr:MoxR family ATPase [Gammaproteobacteria bacterium]MYF38529.1 MoxR family ATPase [Gammaproteobacteria bacterium]
MSEIVQSDSSHRIHKVDAETIEAIGKCSHCFSEISANVARVVLGQDDVVDHVLQCLIANGHVLLEGVPGLGKTLLVRALATSIRVDTARIQFTPDLMPSDVTGHAQYSLKQEEFIIRKGPVFTNLLLADEINRAPAKTQSALLEIMQERRATIEGESFPVAKPYMVLATQNPIEFEGTYPLPEAQLDRFMINAYIDYPAVDDEVAIVDQVTTGRAVDQLDTSAIEPVATVEDVSMAQEIASKIHIDDEVLKYAVEIVRATRNFNGVTQGASPRAGIALARMARAAALMSNRYFVIPDDIHSTALPALRHRISLSPEFQIEGLSPDKVLEDIISEIPAPRT